MATIGRDVTMENSVTLRPGETQSTTTDKGTGGGKW